jgi:hypothetical protein
MGRLQAGMSRCLAPLWLLVAAVLLGCACLGAVPLLPVAAKGLLVNSAGYSLNNRPLLLDNVDVGLECANDDAATMAVLSRTVAPARCCVVKVSHDSRKGSSRRRIDVVVDADCCCCTAD